MQFDMFHILCINQKYKTHQKANKCTWFYRCNLLHNGHWHVVAIFRMVKTRIQIQSNIRS